MADNGLYGCTWVVDADSRKWGRFWCASSVAQCASGWLVGLVREIVMSVTSVVSSSLCEGPQEQAQTKPLGLTVWLWRW